jgi:hypothetical protein
MTHAQAKRTASYRAFLRSKWLWDAFMARHTHKHPVNKITVWHRSAWFAREPRPRQNTLCRKRPMPKGPTTFGTLS